MLYNGAVDTNWASSPALGGYASGVIRSGKTNPSFEEDLTHASILIGWGEENGIKYWLLRNSYGDDYGVKSVIKIERGVNAFRLEGDLAGFDVELL